LTHIINYAHQIGFKVMLSPIVDPNWDITTNHRSGDDMTWRGLIGLNFTEEQWAEWFHYYTNYTMHYVRLAAQLNVEQFCVGAELNSPFMREREFRLLIANIRKVYSGTLTAAILYFQAISNTTEVPWLDAIDYIGVDAYYELYTNSDNPTVDEIKQAWQPYYQALYDVHQKWNKTIIFVEAGYPSAFRSHVHPAHMELIAFDDCSVWALCVFLQEQANSYEALYQTFYPQDWFGGVYWWLWRTDPEDGGRCDPGFSPVGKPAEMVMTKWFWGNATALTRPARRHPRVY
jgi:hypothetical protein